MVNIDFLNAEHDRALNGALSVALPPENAPKDGTLLRLLVDYRGEHGAGPLEDEDQAWTVGFNDLANTGEDEWQIAGWNWSQDCFTEGHGAVIGWLPFHELAATPAPVEAGLIEAVERELAAAFTFTSFNTFVGTHQITQQGETEFITRKEFQRVIDDIGQRVRSTLRAQSSPALQRKVNS